jgi:ABC-type branched-subunit amino acid transport system substrate-binding protein
MPRTFIAGLLLVAATLLWAPLLPAAETAAGRNSATAADPASALLALAEAKAAAGESLQALVIIHQALAVPAAPRADELLARAHGLLQNHLDDSQLAEAAFMFRSSPLGQDALLQQAMRAAARGERVVALRLAENLVQGGRSFPYRPEAVGLWEQLTGQSWLQRAVGVLLPLSGRFATFGELVRRGMDLALEMRQEGGKRPVRFLYRDTGADATLSAQAVLELAEGERVLAIIGPLTGSDAQAAATQAQQLALPLLALSQKEGLPETGDHIFRESLTSRQQVKALVRYAMEDRQLTSFAILSPENRLGREMVELFAREVADRGGRVVARQSYAENVTDFRRQIKLLKGEDPQAPESADAASRAKPLPFEALFIPDDTDRIGLIAPQLAFYGIERLPLLGTNGWNSPDLVRLAGRFVEGAVFVDGFYRHSPYPFVQEFVNRYFAKYGEEPSILGAQGYDAAGILLTLLARSDIRTREELRLALAQLRDYPGVTGATSFTPQGDSEKVLFLLQVQNGDIVQIN